MKNKISEKKLREFGLLIGFTFPILIGYVIPAISGHYFKFWTLFIGIPALFLGSFKPNTLIYAYKTWMKIGDILGWVNSRIILGLVYLFVVIPISLIMRAFGYDPLQIKNNQKQTTYKKDKRKHIINLKRIF